MTNAMAAVEPIAILSAIPTATVPSQTSKPVGQTRLIVSHGRDIKVITM